MHATVLPSHAAVLASAASICLLLERPQTRKSLCAALLKASAFLGFPTYLLGVRGMVRGERFTLVLSNQNLEWHKEYDRKEYLKVDPYFAHASSRFGPYAWRDIQPTSAAAKAFLARMKEVGLEHGVGSSYITHTGDTGLLTFAGPKEPPGFWSDEGMSVHLMCGAFTRAVVHLHDRPTAGLAEDAALTPQERLCLELSAVGLTAKKIGALHSMSERTVRYHLDCAAEKLKVRTRREAVAEALLRGLIIKLHPTMPKLSDR